MPLLDMDISGINVSGIDVSGMDVSSRDVSPRRPQPGMNVSPERPQSRKRMARRVIPVRKARNTRFKRRPRICLVNMPFAPVEAPSLGLEQLRVVLNRGFAGRVRVEVLYLNMEFLNVMGGLENYRLMTSSHGRLSGAADWLFRQFAFPCAPDNADEFFGRFFAETGNDEARRLRELLVERRPPAGEFLDTLIGKYRLGEAMIVGFTCLFDQTMASLALARRIKEVAPSVLIVLGGASCECGMGLELARRCEQVDYVFSGPALKSFPEFVERRLVGDDAGDAGIPGLFKAGESREESELRAALRGEDMDINLRVGPEYDDFLDSFGRHVKGEEAAPMLFLETSRGCSWGEKSPCAFCGLNGAAMKHRAMSARNAIEQISGMFRYVPRSRFFLAVDTLMPDSFSEEVFPFLATPPGVAMMYEVRPVLSSEQLRKLCRAGVLVIQSGIESLASRTLRLMRKGTTALGNLRFLKDCARLPLRVEWNLLIGTPGESEQVFADYLDLFPRLCHLPPPGGVFPISFDRFSLYFDHPEKYGLELRPHEFYQYVFPFPSEAVRNIAYHFIDARADHDRLNNWLDRLNESVGRWRARRVGADGLVPARLELKSAGNKWVLLDSRDGREREFSVDAGTARLLAFLDQPRRLCDLHRRFGEKTAEKQLSVLREMNALFEENGRALSLAISSDEGIAVLST